jgi:preprotein translocase subunit SecD
MKVLLYIPIFILCFSATVIPVQKPVKTVTVVTGDRNITPGQVEQAATIISQRLGSYGAESQVKLVDADKISVTLPDTMSSAEISELLTARGSIQFPGGLSKADIRPVTHTRGSNDGNAIIQIVFKPEVSKKWAEITRQNIGKPLAISLDGKVMFNPVVRNAIEGGNCEVTGSFTDRDARRFEALVNNPDLPIKLIIK